MEEKEQQLIQSIIDHLLYLKGKDADLFRKEIESVVNHFPMNKNVNYDISKFKFPLKDVLV